MDKKWCIWSPVDKGRGFNENIDIQFVWAYNNLEYKLLAPHAVLQIRLASVHACEELWKLSKLC